MHPNFALRQLVDRVRPNVDEIQAIRDRFGTVQSHLAIVFPRSRFVPVGSHSRGTAIAVHSQVDFLAVLPSEWASWGGRRVSPVSIIDRMTENLLHLQLAPEVRRDGRGIELYIKGFTFAVDLMPGFAVRSSDGYPVYSLPGDDNQWIAASPERHNALFSYANARCGAKLRAISHLVKIWRIAGSPPFGISSLHVDMMLATSDIASGIKSYGQCRNDFFKELLQREIRDLSDPACTSSAIVATPSSDARQRLYEAARVATEHARAALDAHARGAYAEANCQWEAIFKRRISRRRLVH